MWSLRTEGDTNDGLCRFVCGYGRIPQADATTQNDEWRKTGTLITKRRPTTERTKVLTVVFFIYCAKKLYNSMLSKSGQVDS
jgi:hypothetical protein